MSVTRLKRKHRKNIARANNETRKIKNLLRTPVLKNVDLDELKSRFSETAPVAGLVEKASQVATAAADSVKEAAATVVSTSTEAVAKAEEAVSNATEAVTASGTSLFDRVKEAASHAVDVVSHASVVEKAKGAIGDAAEAITHTGAFEAVQGAAHNLVESAKHVLETKSPEENQATEANQTGTEGFDAAEAVTKPVNEDGQEGDKPKPEIAL
jgi:phage-related protein